LSPSTIVELKNEGEDQTLVLGAAVRNLIEFHSECTSSSQNEEVRQPYIGGSFIRSTDSLALNFANFQVERIKQSSSIRASQFASSASYMGSKRNLSAFVSEVISRDAASNSIVLDIMTGSGAAAAAFCKHWRTLASDAQAFSRILAVVQGAGYSVEQADKTLNRVLPIARTHSLTLRQLIDPFLRWEDRVFHGDIGNEAILDYRSLIEAFPTYPDGQRAWDWDPVGEVDKRKSNPELDPYCLFTAYFANVFFGIRQCVEIDSLRFAISKLESNEDRTWALGALLAAISSLGTTYGGHFAQPIVRHSDDITSSNIGSIVERRASSVFHEFSVRLESLGMESEHCPYQIEPVTGPWQQTLVEASRILNSREVVVYLDAPYKREEYSRYYHVLETLVQYNYPSSNRIGRMPDKVAGERFSSEFFSRRQSKIEDAFVTVICSILKNGWKCAWSYSDNGDANIVSVCSSIEERTSCNISSYATPYVHNSLGGPSGKSVTEYLIVFAP
jgi:hypothetical protein